MALKEFGKLSCRISKKNQTDRSFLSHTHTRKIKGSCRWAAEEGGFQIGDEAMRFGTCVG
jgi:hypothetical protein